MAIIAVLTDVGEQLRAQHLVDGTTYQITKIKAGAGHVTTAALAVARTDIVTPLVPARENDNPAGVALAHDPVAQVRYVDPASVTYDIKEFGVFVGTQMTHFICDDAGAILYHKTPTLTLDVGIYIAVASGDQAAFTFQEAAANALATTEQTGLVELASDAEVATPPAKARALTTDNMDAIGNKVFDDKVETYQWSEITIDSDAGTGWRGRISSVDSSGAITGIENSGGTGYATGDTAAVKAGVGTGATLTVTVAAGVPTVSVNAAGSGYGVAKPLTLAAGVEYRLYEAVD